MSVAVLMTCHNRVETTLACLRRLMPQLSPTDCVFLVNDGSTDGTGARVRSEFPAVRVIDADGTLYWAKGMRKAWGKAVDTGVSYDSYLWLNDDVMLKPNALAAISADYSQVINASSSTPVVVGACSFNGKCTYSGTDAKDLKICPNGQPQLAEGWFNGNFVLVPRKVFAKVGVISSDYTHARADYDYAERLKLAGIPFYVSSKYVGECPFDFAEKVRGKGLFKRLSWLWRPGYFNLHDLYLIRSRYHGHLRAMASCFRLVQLVVLGNIC